MRTILRTETVGCRKTVVSFRMIFDGLDVIAEGVIVSRQEPLGRWDVL